MTPAEPAEDVDLVAVSDIDVPRLFARVEDALLGGGRRYTPDQVAAEAGVSREETRGLWRALGFAAVGDDDAIYHDSDVAAAKLVGELRAAGFQDEQLVSAMTRLFGQTFSRLASWQGQLLLEMLSDQPELLGSEEAVFGLIDQVTPLLEQLQNYAWRRQLVAYFARVAGSAETLSTPAARPVAIGFVDMSGFTSLTRRSSEVELRELLDAFESFATEIVGSYGGRIVKTIGDEILFQADDAGDAAEIALDMFDAAGADPRLPDLRAGIAVGPVVSRLGDVYGSTVNIASRLTSLSRPGWILVDRGMHDRLRDDPRYYLKSRRPESVRGFSHLHPWRLRRARPQPPS